jgi:hypothetical protein
MRTVVAGFLEAAGPTASAPRAARPPHHVGLTFERRAVVQRGALRLDRRLHPTVRLLHGMRKLVSKDLLTPGTARLVAPRGEMDVGGPL